MADIAQRFRGWKRTGWRRYNQPEIAAAVLDPTKRAALLTSGLRPETRAPEEPEEVPPDAPTQGHFTPQAFEFLTQLHLDPTHEFYTAHKEALREHIVAPFKELMGAVRDQLPLPIRERMETEKRVYASILKQFAQQGCWDFYWGAFYYPKGGKRTEGAQLSLSINRDRLAYGFYIGEYGSEQRSRFVRNCQEHYAPLLSVLNESLGSLPRLSFAWREELDRDPKGAKERAGPTLAEWLQGSAEADIHATVFMPRDEVLQCTKEQLAREIADVFQRLFPLVLVAALDEPMPDIGAYMETLQPIEPPEPSEFNPEYPLVQCAEDTHLDRPLLERWVRAIERKGQAILYGRPAPSRPSARP